MSRSKNNGNRKKKASRIGYNLAKRWIANKVRKLERHMKNQENDTQGQSALDRAKALV